MATVLAVAAVALVACEPPPPADGRDLGVAIVSAPTTLTAGGTGSITAVVMNHGSTTAGGARFATLASPGLQVDAVTGAGVSGCTFDGDVAGCDLGDLTPGHHRIIAISVRGVASAPDGQVTLGASSAGTEPEPDPHPNRAVQPVPVVSVARSILFDRPEPVTPGTVFDVQGTTVTDSPFISDGIRLTVPAHLEAVSVTLAGRTATCAPTGDCGGLPMWGIGPGSPVTIRLRALSPAPPAQVGLRVEWYEIGAIGGRTSVQVVDPTVTSEVHPELDPVAEGVVGIAQPVSGTVRNTGSSDHRAVVATVQVPDGVRVDEATWGPAGHPCAVDGREVTCSIGVLPGRSAVPLAMRVTPLASGSGPVDASVSSGTAQDDPDPVADTTSATYTVLADHVDLGVTATADPSPPVEGADWNLAPVITNHGTIAATGVEVTVAFPAGVDARPVAVLAPVPAGWRGCTATGSTATCRTDSLAPGAALRLRATADLVVADTGDVVVTAASDRVEPLPDAHPNRFAVPLAVIAPHADVASTLTAPAVAYQGQPTTIEAGLRNLGPSVIATTGNVLVLPSSWTITSVVAGYGSTCSVDGTTVTCLASDVLRTSRPSATVVAVPGAVGPGQTIRNSTSSSLPDSDPGNNESLRTVDVRPAAVDLGVTASGDASLPAGTPRALNLTVRNAGPAVALDTVLTVAVPAALAVEQVATGSTGFTCTPGAGTLTCTHPALPVGTATIGLTVRPIALGQASVVATVTTATTEAPDALANTVSALRTVTPVAAILQGRMVDPAGTPVTGTARLYRVGEATPYRTATVYSYGTYSFTVEPGSYQLELLPQVTLRPTWFGGPTRSGATVFTVADLGEVHQLDVTLEPKVLTAGRGRVVDGTGTPVPGVAVSFYREGDGLLPTHHTLTAADGTWSMPITEGSYRVAFGPPSGSALRAEWYDDQPSRALAAVLVAPSTPGSHELVVDGTLGPA